MRTRTGRVLKVNQTLGERWMAMKAGKSKRKVQRLRGLPKSRLKRWAWRMQPQRLKEYWWSRDGAIMALKISGIGILALFILTMAVFAYFRKDLKSITDISGGNLGGSISYYDRTGQTLLWQDYNAVKRVPVQGNQISNYVKQATVAVEDKDFYKHRGFDIRAIVRASLSDVLHHGGTQGGSTITQQLVKLTQDFGQNRSIALKIKELILAVELERTYSKEEILTRYLDAAPYGGVDYGVQSAASDYFHENAKDLTLAQSAFLAAIPKAPSIYSPYDKENFNRAGLISRQKYILDLMVSQKMITKAQAAEAKKVDVLAQVQPQQTKYAGIQAPYFVLAAKDELLQRCSDNKGNCSAGGWKVITTLDLNMQGKAEAIVAKNFPSIQRYTGGRADEEATVLEDVQTGQIQALVGGTDFTDPDHGEINYAHNALIPPGSSFKPYDYTTLIENHTDAGAGSVLYDTQSPLKDYGYPCTAQFVSSDNPGNCLRDYDGLQPGPLTLRYALGGSRNIPAVKAMLEAIPGDTSNGHVNSINKVISTASAMMANPSHPKAYQCYQQGVDINIATQADVTQCYGASAIGDGAFLHLDDHVNGLATLARLGSAIPRTYILKIVNSGGKTIYQYKQPKPTQVVRPESAYIVNNMASDPNASYLPGSYKFQRDNGWTFAVKTGTTNNGFDGLMTSWSTQFAVVSWVGNHTRNVNLGGPGMEYLTEPLTRGMMEAAHASLKPVDWSEPTGLQHLPAFVVRNHIHYGDIEPSPSNDLFPSWYKGKSGSASSATSTIDKVSNKLATSCTPPLAKQTVGGSSAVNQFSIDIFYPPGGAANSDNAAATSGDDVHDCGDSLPAITITVDDSKGNTVNKDCTNTCTFVTAVTAGTHPLTDPQYASAGGGYVNFLVNGQVVNRAELGGDTSPTYTYTVTSPGPMTVSAQVVDSVLYETDATPVQVEGKVKTTFLPGGQATLASYGFGPTLPVKYQPRNHGR